MSKKQKTRTSKLASSTGSAKKADAAASAASDKARQAAIAQIDARLEGTPGKASPPNKRGKGNATKPGKTPKQSKPPAIKRVSALDAAAQVLATAKQPMRAQELIAEMAKRGLWKSPGGATPHATLYAAMIREIKASGKDARFKKTDRGLFIATGAAKGA